MLLLPASLCPMWSVSEYEANITPLSCDQPNARSRQNKQTNKIQSLLNLNSDFNLSFNDNELNKYLSSVYCKSATTVI